MIKYILNAFSLNMVDYENYSINVEEVSLNQAKKLVIGATSAIGHYNTANVISNKLKYKIEQNRISVELKRDDKVLVAQYKGSRLEEGATQLPKKSIIKWLVITVS